LLVVVEADRMTTVTQTVEVLVLDLLEWLSRKDRSYEETMDAWRTSCPKLPVWEDAADLGWVCVKTRNGRSSVHVTPAGYELLKKMRPEQVL
jgi:D-3-phosphoglycerate dehydrogenase